MVQSGSAVYTDPDDYQAGIGIAGASVSLVLNTKEAFKGRLTWLKQRDLYLLTARENVPCIASCTLAPTRTFISFPASSNTALIWGGVALQFGDVVFHSPGERAHQWTKGASTWGLASLPSDRFATYSKVLMGFELTAPPVSRVLRPLPKAISHLRRLHASACRLAETRPDIHAHTEVVRAIEEEYAHALISCLTAKDAYGNLIVKRRQEDIVLQFENSLSDQANQALSLQKVCAALRVTNKDLTLSCADVLGISPSRYIRVKRNVTRAATALC
jgi:hypothetical protein